MRKQTRKFNKNKKHQYSKKKKSHRKTKGYRGGGGNEINYVISSHGSELESEFTIPENVTIVFYCKKGKILYCSNESPENICSGSLPTVQSKVNTDIKNDIKPCHIIFGGATTSDYSLIPDYMDEDGQFGEIFKCHAGKAILAKIPWQMKLSEMIHEIKEHSNRDGNKNKQLIIHCLFCRTS